MPTSDSYRPSNTVRARGGEGFTLLELLIVLALVAIMAAVVAPRLQGTYEAIAGSGERAEVLRQIERLPLHARNAGHAIELPVDGKEATLGDYVDLPEGWSVELLEPVRIEASGACHPTRLRVDGRGTVEEWRLVAPACEVDDGA